jgi:tRNA dimethylallyltransferase
VKVVVVAGPTGSGKSDLAVQLARTLHGEIVNYDSVQIYRGFDIGSAKPPASVRALVPHHLFDIVEAGQDFNAADYAHLARRTCEEIANRNALPILVGGTFFYLRALLSGLPEMPGREERVRERIRAISARPQGPQHLHSWLGRIDPVSAGRIPPTDRHRVERALEVWITSGRPISSWGRPSAETESTIASLKIGIDVERSVLVERLDRRVEEMYRNGLVEETRELLTRYSRDARPFGTIGYREAAAVVDGTLDIKAAIEETRRRTRAYAKRQMTWLRSDQNVQWVAGAGREEIFAAAMRLIERFQLE